MAVKRLKNEKIIELKKTFLSFDNDNDCKITIKQMCTILKQDLNSFVNNQKEPPFNNKFLVELIGSIKIDFTTFLELYAKHQLELINYWKQIDAEILGGHTSDEIKKKMFSMMDQDGSGGISFDELAHSIKLRLEYDFEVEDDAGTIASVYNEESVKTHFKHIDADKDGILSYEEVNRDDE